MRYLDKYLADSVAKKLKGFALINGLCEIDDTPYRQYQISQTTRILGEVIEVVLNEREEQKIKQALSKGPARLVRSRCKLTKLTLDGAYYEITIKDKDIKSAEYPSALYTESEWERAVNEYVTIPGVRRVYQESILRSLGLGYSLEQIFFEANVKITIGTRLSEAAEVAQGAFEKMQDITEERMIQAMKDYEKEHKQQ